MIRTETLHPLIRSCDNLIKIFYVNCLFFKIDWEKLRLDVNLGQLKSLLPCPGMSLGPESHNPRGVQEIQLVECLLWISWRHFSTCWRSARRRSSLRNVHRFLCWDEKRAGWSTTDVKEDRFWGANWAGWSTIDVNGDAQKSSPYLTKSSGAPGTWGLDYEEEAKAAPVCSKMEKQIKSYL